MDIIIELGHSISNKIPYGLNKSLDQPSHLRNSIKDFAICLKTLWILGYSQSAPQRLWSDCADVQADLSLHWAHMQSCRKRCAPAQLQMVKWQMIY